MKFIVEIEIGNDAMSTRDHVAQALRVLATKLVRGAIDTETLDCGKILDENGNSVGGWEVRE